MNSSEFATLEQILSPIFRVLLASLASRTSVSLGGAVIADIGGGTGPWLDACSCEPIRAGLLFDPSEPSLAYAREKWERRRENRLSAIRAQAENLPLNPATVEVIISRNSLQFWKDRKKALEEFFRILRPGGTLFIGRGFGPDLGEDPRRRIKEARREFYRSLNIVHDEADSPPAATLAGEAKSVGFQGISIIPDHNSYWLLAGKP